MQLALDIFKIDAKLSFVNKHANLITVLPRSSLRSPAPQTIKAMKGEAIDAEGI